MKHRDMRISFKTLICVSPLYAYKPADYREIALPLLAPSGFPLNFTELRCPATHARRVTRGTLMIITTGVEERKKARDIGAISAAAAGGIVRER